MIENSEVLYSAANGLSLARHLNASRSDVLIGIARITLNRPARMNAISDDLPIQLESAIQRAGNVRYSKLSQQLIVLCQNPGAYTPHIK